MSAAANAPSLLPNLLYDGSEDQFTSWYRGVGGVIHNHQLSFMDKLNEAIALGWKKKEWANMYGAFFRIDLPFVINKMELDSAKVETCYVLYTDTDVMFLNDIDSCSFKCPNTMMMGPEHKRGTKTNSGVLVVNVAALRRDYQGLVNWGVENRWPGAYDQPMLISFYRDSLQLLPDEYNWKAYWGPAQNATVIHFHGPKPERCLDCLVTASILDGNLRVCGCPSVYLNIFRMAPDGGKYYGAMLLSWYKYLLKSMNGPAV